MSGIDPGAANMPATPLPRPSFDIDLMLELCTIIERRCGRALVPTSTQLLIVKDVMDLMSRRESALVTAVLNDQIGEYVDPTDIVTKAHN